MGANNSCEISRLPEDCLSRIISLTSPRDACRCSTVSTTFRSAAAADAVWEYFIPTDINNIISKTPDRPAFTSKMDLYFHLSNHGILVDDGKMNLKLDRSSGAKIYMLSAVRTLGIVWGENPQYWQRVPNNDSRFSEVEQLILVWWFEIHAKFSCKKLTAKTRYAAYFVFKLEDGSSGFDLPFDALLSFGDDESRQRICLEPRKGITKNPNNLIRYPQLRDDQWSEVEVAEFYNDGEEGRDIALRVQETEELLAKIGLLFNGIEFRPKI